MEKVKKRRRKKAEEKEQNKTWIYKTVVGELKMRIRKGERKKIYIYIYIFLRFVTTNSLLSLICTQEYACMYT